MASRDGRVPQQATPNCFHRRSLLTSLNYMNTDVQEKNHGADGTRILGIGDRLASEEQNKSP